MNPLLLPDRWNPLAEGEFETGCHTDVGNDLILFLQTTARLSERRDAAFAAALAGQPPSWPSGVVERLTVPLRELFHETTKAYRREVGQDPYGEDEPVARPDVYVDFFGCCVRDFARWRDERAIQQRVAAATAVDEARLAARAAGRSFHAASAPAGLDGPHA